MCEYPEHCPVKEMEESDPGVQFPAKAELDVGTQFQGAVDGYWEYQSSYLVWIAIVVVLIILMYRCSKRRKKLRLRFRVECYGKGDIHKDILMNSSVYDDDPRIPYVFYVYKVSREIEDLRNALQYAEKKQTLKKKDICAVILLENASNARNRQIDVNHQGIFDYKTVVVRILWKEKWFLFPRKIQKGPGYQKAMRKVIQSIRDWEQKK
ncbi:uncharacterized protein [Chiloscyllium punctatum]|uniref:uncharacterized protein isoform X2 n=1 Tax=Chiloscyllium punctatum TaxID=137246 RepID=UPI003B638742